MEVLYKCGGRLVGERARRPSSVTITELLFVDDTAVVNTTRESMERAALMLDKVTSEWGLTVSVHKTKLMVAGVQSEDEGDIQPIQIRVEVVPAFRYLGSVIEAYGGIMKDVEDKIACASRVFGALHRPVFKDKNLSEDKDDVPSCGA